MFGGYPQSSSTRLAAMRHTCPTSSTASWRGRAADILDVRLILDVPLERRCDGPVRHARAGSPQRAPLRRRTVEPHPTDRSHAQAGIVSRLWRYPVKSMAGEALASTDISWAGLAGDRRWAFVRPDSQDSGFPPHRLCVPARDRPRGSGRPGQALSLCRCSEQGELLGWCRRASPRWGRLRGLRRF